MQALSSLLAEGTAAGFAQDHANRGNNSQTVGGTTPRFRMQGRVSRASAELDAYEPEESRTIDETWRYR
jgi:hypothetical protein